MRKEHVWDITISHPMTEDNRQEFLVELNRVLFPRFRNLLSVPKVHLFYFVYKYSTPDWFDEAGKYRFVIRYQGITKYHVRLQRLDV